MINKANLASISPIIAVLLLFCSNQVLGNPNLSDIIVGSHRAEGHIDRNQFRHPVETLQFFDVQPNMTVVEIWPGAQGWYTEILAPYLKDQGKLYAAHFSPNAERKYFIESLEKFRQKLEQHPELYGSIVISALDAPKEVDIAPPNSADRILTFRNVHNWLRQKDNGLSVFKAMYNSLKPGGILGVVEHRAADNTSLKQMQDSGYTSEAFATELAEKAGFKLLAKTDVNANSKDTKNYPKGVWTLPPSLRLGDQDKAKYLAIGESDRMTLKFIKPVE